MSAQQHLSAIIAAVAARSGYSVTVGTLERLRDEIDADIAAAFEDGKRIGCIAPSMYHAGAGDDEA